MNASVFIQLGIRADKVTASPERTCRQGNHANRTGFDDGVTFEIRFFG